jgi:hypothetical protein
MTISVPIQQVGAVIGNRGATVRQICEESGARIHIEGKDEIAPDAKERAVTITGSTSQVSRAFELIQTALAESNEARNKANNSQSNNGLPPLHVISSTLPPFQQQQRRDYPYQQQPPPPHMQYPPQQSYYPLPQQQQQQPYFQPAPYPPMRSSNPVPMPSLPPLPPLPSSQDPSQRFFDPDKLSILASQLAKNFPPVGSGNITQITGSPPQQPPQSQNQSRQRY